MAPPPVIHTERLVLRALDPRRDAESLHAAYTDAETMRWWHQPVSKSVGETAARIDELCGQTAQFAICTEEAGPAVGHVGWLSAPKGRRGGFGYLLRREHWGRGIATEGASRALEYGFTTFGPSDAELWVYEENRPSAALAARLGGVLRGRFYGFNLARGEAIPTLVFGIANPDGTQRAKRPVVLRAIPSIEVADLAATTSFWTDRLGFEVEFTTGDPPAMVSLFRGDWPPLGAVVRFRAGAPSADAALPAKTVLDLMVDDVDALYAEVSAAGAQAVAPPESKPWGLREFTVIDPGGTPVRFYAPAPREGSL